MSQKGDAHNFGRFVTCRFKKNLLTFEKPRTTFWEWLFFGCDSPLKSIFSQTPISMNLKVVSNADLFQNEVEGIISTYRKPTAQDYTSFGHLLAYCFFFGIQDLHKDNLILTSNGIQIIDAEQVFSSLLIPNQTLLLPVNSDITWSAGINILKEPNLDKLNIQFSKLLIDGFYSHATFFIQNIQSILNKLEDTRKTLVKYPIRVFFRGTREYAEHINKKNMILNLFEEESIQLQRGDVPYFFTYMGSKSIFYYSSKDWNVTEVNVPNDFLKFVDYCNKDYRELLNEKNIEEQMIRGMLFLSKKLVNLESKDLSWPEMKIVKYSNKLILEYKHFSASSRL